MSQENVELVRRAYELFNERDLEAAGALMDQAEIRFPDWSWATDLQGVARGALLVGNAVQHRRSGSPARGGVSPSNAPHR